MERESSLWTLFNKKDDFIATCNTCQKDYSYRASVSNLRKHWVRKHGGHLSVSDRNNDNSDGEEQEDAFAQVSDKVLWRLVDGDNFEPSCKICDKNLSGESVPEMAQHLQDHEEKPKGSDDKDYVPEVQQKILKRKYKSKVWDYFEAADDKMAICLLCKKFFNFSSSISNLRKHLQRIHKEINLTPVAKKIYINGELYEIASEQEQDENESNMEITEMDPICLSNDSIAKSTTPSPKEKHPKILPKRHLLLTGAGPLVLEEPVHSNKNTCSEILEHPKKEIPLYTSTTEASIDYFGQYVVSLLKELPKPVSDRLQSEIIKQIFTAKMDLDSQTAAAAHEIKICKNDKNVTNVPEPVCYTVVQTNEADEKLTGEEGSIVKELLNMTRS